MPDLLNVNDLKVEFHATEGVVRAVNGVSFRVPAGKTVALVGESGSGKSVVSQTIMGILPKSAKVTGGEVIFHDPRDGSSTDLLTLDQEGERMRAIRGGRISIIFQEPMTSLSPVHTVGDQISEALFLHREVTKAEGMELTAEMLRLVGFPEPQRALRTYPFELSGGLRQRAMIAMAMISKPEVLIADEPTTALDVTTQAQVLGLIKELQKETGTAVILVTHDLGVVANMAETVVVMNKGRVMESGSAKLVLTSPAHGYTKKLFAAAPTIPDVASPAPPLAHDDLILTMKNVSKTYIVRGNSRWKPSIEVNACRGVDLAVTRGKTLAIVGESGSGKTTCARIALGAELPDPGGEVVFRGPGAFRFTKDVVPALTEMEPGHKVRCHA